MLGEEGFYTRHFERLKGARQSMPLSVITQLDRGICEFLNHEDTKNTKFVRPLTAVIPTKVGIFY